MQTRARKLSIEDSSETAERIHRVENGLPAISSSGNEPLIPLALPKLMELYKVPGLSMAVIDNFKIAWAKGYGVTEAGTSNPVTPHTLFQAGSVSKPVAATGALFLAEQGKLLLDENVNQKLTAWQVPDNEFTREQKVTLRRILSHSAGLTVHGFPGYGLDEPVPTLVQVLNGEKPSNTAPVRVHFVPSTKWSYSGGGILIAQQLMMDVTGKPFPQLMREMVLEKIGMHDSSYEQPLPPEENRMAASGTSWNGEVVPGKWHIYPEMAAAGLWTTASDLASFAIEIALSKRGESNRVLSQAMTREMLAIQIEPLTEFAFGNKQHPDRMGLGFFLGDQTRPDLFGHIGDDEGFQAMLMMYSDSGQGAAIMANSEFGILLGDYLIENIAQEYDWKRHSPPDRPRLGASAALLATAHFQNIQAALRQYQALKLQNPSRFTPNKDTLLIFAYLLLADNKLQDTLEALKLEVEEYPEYWDAFNTLAKVYMLFGERQLAIQNFEKSVELNPDNRSALENIKTLGGQN
jgi:CubicO group peptidase (beta-lactamase class C family)